jgi:hypothetical protein
MPTNRTRRRRTPHPDLPRITPELVKLYKRILEIRAAGLDDIWEDQGGRKREMYDARAELHRGLGLNPWHYSPTDVALDGPPNADEDPERHALAQELRRALEAAFAAGVGDA